MNRLLVPASVRLPTRIEQQQSLHCGHYLPDAEWLQRVVTKRLGVFMLLKTVSDAAMNETGHFILTNCKGHSELV